jgi:tellurite resistance protein
MGYSETNAARNHDGLCIACYVKSLVKSKVDAANKTQKPTNAKSIDNLFEKFENLLITSETATNLRVRKRFGLVHGEASLAGTPHEKRKLFDLFKKKEEVC